MTLFIGVVSQKGGVGKSSLCQLIGREYAEADWNAVIADMDISQATSFHWNRDRQEAGIKPVIAVETFSRINRAVEVASAYDLMIFDGPPHSTAGTLQIAQQSQLVILPTGLSIRDLEPTIKLAHELKQNGIPTAKLAIALCRVGDSQSENQEAIDYIKASGYSLLDGVIPERTGYRRALDAGRALTETHYPSLNQKADGVIQAIADRIEQLKRKAV